MHYVRQFNINGVDTKQVACIELHGKPNAATEGCVGVLGIDMDSPIHEVYKCVAVNGSIYTWELLSSGLSILGANLRGEGAATVEFPYDKLNLPLLYVVKVGDSIMDLDGRLYQVVAIGASSCSAAYCNTQFVAYGKSAYELAVEQGFEGTVDEWLLSLEGSRAVYVGSGEMPEYADIQIDPEGDNGDDPLIAQMTEIEGMVNECESKINRNDKRLANLERIFKVETFETDATVAYTKDVPVNALPYAELAKVGGMSYEEGGVLKSAPVTDIVMEGKNLIDAATAKVTTSYKNQSEEIIKNERYGTGIKMTALKDITTCWGRGGIIVGLTKDFLGKTLTVSAENVVYSSLTEKSVPVYAAQLAKRDGYYEDTASGSYVSLGSKTGASFTFTVNSDADYNAYPYVRVSFYPTNGGNLVVGDYVIYEDIMVEVSDTKTPYSPYTKNTTPIPEVVQSLDGYGWGISELVYNYVDFEKKQFVKRVEKLVLDGTEAWEYAYSRFALTIAKNATQYTDKCLCDKYEHNQNVYKDANREMGIVAHRNRIFVRDANYTSISAWKTQLASNPVTIYYELAEPIITDISDILPDDNYIEVEGGGTLTFENEHKLAVPSEITYQLKEAAA